jgi:hypothetical protein
MIRFTINFLFESLELLLVVVDLPLFVIHEAVGESSAVSHYYSDRSFDKPRKPHCFFAY